MLSNDTHSEVSTWGYRLLCDVHSASLTLEDQQQRVLPLTYLSPEKVGLLWDELTPPPLGQPLPITLQIRGERVAPLLARVERLLPPRAGAYPELVLSLRPPLLQGRRLLSLLEDLLTSGLASLPPSRIKRQETILEPDRIQKMAVVLVANRHRGLLLSSHAPSQQLQAVALRHPDAICWEITAPPPPAPFVIEIEWLHSLFRFSVEEAEVVDGRLVTPLPRQIVRLRRRWCRRAPASEQDVITFWHPLWPELFVRRPLHDISYGGLSFFAHPDCDLVYPGLAVEAEITHAEEPPTRVRAEVCSLTPRVPGEEKALCRMRVRPSSQEDTRRWQERVDARLYPGTRIGSAYDQAAWDLYEASGYFHLSRKEPSQFQEIKAPYFAISRKLDQAPHLGYRVVWPSPRGIEASASCLKVYTSTWMGHQMAKRPKLQPPTLSPKKVLREIYFRTHEMAQADPEFRWLLGYIEGNVRWMQTAHIEFAAVHVQSGQAFVLPFRLWEVPCAPLPDPSPAEIAVEAPQPEELAFWLDFLAQKRPRAYRDALDLYPERFDLAALRDSWAAAHLGRERAALVASCQGKPAALAILESGEVGTNLFHLLDSVRIFSLEEQDAGPELTTALFRAAITWFRERERQVFVYFQEEESSLPDFPLHDLGPGHLWVLAAELLPEWMEHIYQLTSPKAPPLA